MWTVSKLCVCFPAYPCCYRNHKGGHRSSSKLERTHHNTMLSCGYGHVLYKTSHLLFRAVSINIKSYALQPVCALLDVCVSVNIYTIHGTHTSYTGSPFKVLIGWKQQLSLVADCKQIQAHVGEYVQMTMCAVCFLMSGVSMSYCMICCTMQLISPHLELGDTVL